MLMIALAGWPMAAGAQEMSPIHCLSEPELQRISGEFQGALKPYGLDKPEQLNRSMQTMMSDAMDKRAKADACSEKSGAARCKAEEQAADAAEKRIEKLGEDMEKLQGDLIKIRNRYRKC